MLRIPIIFELGFLLFHDKNSYFFLYTYEKLTSYIYIKIPYYITTRILKLYTMENKLLFVYGTLKRGFGNNRLINHTKFIGTAISVDKYYVDGWGFPCASLNKNGKPLQGEIYELTERDFISTDMLESNGFLYQREIKKFNLNGEDLESWIYIIIDPVTHPYKTDSDVINWKNGY